MLPQSLFDERNSVMGISKKRFLPFDMLRIIATLSVIALHSAANYWYTLPVNTSGWFYSNLFISLNRFCVPIFVMISGALFLSPSREVKPERLLKHNVLHLLCVYAFWSIVYGLLYCQVTGFENMTVKEILKRFLTAKYHLWFLSLIIGIYFLVPILRTWVKHASRKELEYFLGLFFGWQVLANTALCYIRVEELHTLYQNFRIEMVCGYIGYFVLGYYLTEFELSRRFQKLLSYALPVFCIINPLLSTYISRRRQTPCNDVVDVFSLGGFAITVSLFYLFTNKLKTVQLSSRSEKRLTKISDATLGIYAMHLVFLEHPNPLLSAIKELPLVAAIPALILTTFVLCLIVSLILKKCPVLGKYVC